MSRLLRTTLKACVHRSKRACLGDRNELHDLYAEGLANFTKGNRLACREQRLPGSPVF